MREGGTSFSGRLVGNSGVSGLMLLGIPSVFLVGCSISVQISVWDPAHQYQRLVSSSLTFTSVTPCLSTPLCSLRLQPMDCYTPARSE